MWLFNRGVESSTKTDCLLVKIMSEQKKVNSMTGSENVATFSYTLNVPREIWLTSTFTFVVGAFLFGGGIYLIYNGTINNVTDFVVLGSCGSLVGFCFSSVGYILLYKSVSDSHKRRRLTQIQSETNNLLASYLTDGQAGQLADGQTRLLTPFRTEHLVSPKTENVDLQHSHNSGTGRNTNTTQSRNSSVSTNVNLYEHFPTSAVTVCGDVGKSKPDLQLGKASRKENNNSVLSTVDEKKCFTFNKKKLKRDQIKKESTLTTQSLFGKQTAVTGLTHKTTNPLLGKQTAVKGSSKTTQSLLGKQTAVKETTHKTTASLLRKQTAVKESTLACPSILGKQTVLKESTLTTQPSLGKQTTVKESTLTCPSILGKQTVLKESTLTTQPSLGKQTTVKESTLTTPSILGKQTVLKESTLTTQPLFGKQADVKESTLTTPSIFGKETAVKEMSRESISSNFYTDCRKPNRESITVVVAEVHAEPTSSGTSYPNSYLLDPEMYEYNVQEPLASSFESLSYDDDDVFSLQDFITGDNFSRPDTGVGESISEDDCPFANDDVSFIYRVNHSFSDNANITLSRMAMHDPLIYSPSDDVQHSYILNNCHAITEVMVHSG